MCVPFCKKKILQTLTKIMNIFSHFGKFLEKGIWIFVFLMIWTLKMRYSKTICKNTLFVANAYLQSYNPNNVNALIMFIVHYFLNYIPHFLHKYLALPLWGGGGSTPNPPWVRIISLLFVNLEDVCGRAVCASNAQHYPMRMATSRVLHNYYKAVLIRYSI